MIQNLVILDRLSVPAALPLGWVSDWLPRAVSAVERWQGARNFRSGGPVSQHWVTLGLVATLVVLVALLVGITLARLKRDRQREETLFNENVRRHSLSVHEYQLLLDVLRESGLRRHSQLFRRLDAYERGGERLLARCAVQSPESEDRLRADLAFLRDKLGLARHGQTPAATDPTLPATTDGTKRHRLSSRELALGKELYITRRLENADDDFHGTIVANTNDRLEIKVDAPIRINFGEVWRARYYFGASVWEFETTVISYDGQRLVLRHSQDVRFVNRRRFARVPTEHQGLIARYPLVHGEDTTPEAWQPAVFVPAVVTELAGPGLRLETGLQLKPDDRVLVAFRINVPDGSGVKAYVVNTLGDVKRVEPLYDRFTVVLHVIGLRDRDIDHLVRLTNHVACTHTPGSPNPEVPAAPEPVETDAVLEGVIQGPGGDDV